MLALTDASLARLVRATQPLSPEARSAYLRTIAQKLDPPPDLVKSRTAKYLDQNGSATSDLPTTVNSPTTGSGT